ncbi:hypothetical protein TEA_028614 [Camellia sinensis var. sinensis]|uniref:Oberon coiled-coil region domain-containing protein n=1 Tax=Camellia sinensis var. sinensis TaxID=542762 RepID=A0A4S4DI23_CAMSN|nr:hypothetical protein TEA_028614 [Camellia sinensis var. sinensis]
MQFHCLGCGHASEMFGFVKDVFMSCAKDWGLETLLKELDCVGKIFRGSEDFKGKELHIKADEMLSKLENKLMSPSDVCNFILQFFNYTDGMSDFTSSSVPPKELLANQTNPRNDAAPLRTPKSLPPKSCFYNMNSLQHDLHQSDLNTTPMGDKMIKDEWSVKSSSSKKDGYDSLESIVRIKEVESRMFQNRADEARREAENYRRMVRMKNEKLEEEYAEKLAKLCLQETEERRRKKQEEFSLARALALFFSFLLSSTIAEASAIAEDHQPHRRRGHHSVGVDIFLHNLSLAFDLKTLTLIEYLIWMLNHQLNHLTA